MVRLTVDPVGGIWFVGACALALYVTFWLIRPDGDIEPRRRFTLVVLRGLFLAALIFGMLRPALVYSLANPRKPALVFLVDGSRSMGVSDELGGKSRWAAARGALEGLAPIWPRLRERFTPRTYVFSQGLAAVADMEDAPGKLPDSPDGSQTALGAALEQVIRADFGKGLAGVVVLTDGAQRAYPPGDVPPASVARRLGQLDVPIITVPFGQPRGKTQTRDVGISDFLVNPSVFVKNELTVEATITADGFANRQVPVELLFEATPSGPMTTVASTTILPSQDVERIPISLTVIPEIPGEFKVALRVADQPNELVTTNNSVSTLVTVLPGGLRVFYAEGTLRRERTFLLRALDASPDIQVESRWIDARTRDQWPIDLGEAVQPGAFDVFILGDLDASVWRPQDLASLAERVSEGAGLMMIGGKQSFGPGGYAETKFSEVLPIEMDRRERQRLDEPPGPGLHLLGPIAMMPTEEAAGSFVMRLAPGRDGIDVWNSLPKLDGANQFRGVKRTASVLARAERGEPLLVAGQFGLGRTLAFAGDSTWRWVMQGGHDEAHKRFWRQAVLWLARQDQRGEGAVWVELPSRRNALYSSVEVRAGVDTAEGDPVLDATFTAQVTMPDGKTTPLALSPQGTEFAGSFLDSGIPGDYVVEVRAETNRTALGIARARFLVFDRDLELENPAADHELPARLAQITGEAGGAVVPPERLRETLEKLADRPTLYDIQVQSRLNLWDNWPYMLLLFALAISEWYLRKRWGLV